MPVGPLKALQRAYLTLPYLCRSSSDLALAMADCWRFAIAIFGAQGA